MQASQKICAVVPVKITAQAKQRLAALLPAVRRQELALAMGIDRPLRHRVFECERHAFLPGHIDPAALAGRDALVEPGQHRDRAVDA